MTTDQPPVRFELISAARQHEPILANLLELYIYDFSQFHDVEIGEDGKFGYPSLSLYWSDPHRHPFLIRVDGKLGGFALVKRGSDITGDQTAWDMAEFFVMRVYRRRGIGTCVVRQVWSRFPGCWQVRVLQSNVTAQEFWARAIAQFTGVAVGPVRVEKDGLCWQVFSFESKPAL